MARFPQRLRSPRPRADQSLATFAWLLLIAIACWANPAAASTAAPDRFAIDIQATAGGAISPDNGGTLMVASGESVTFTFTPDDCYGITELEVDGVLQGPVATYTFTNIHSDHLIYATFQPRTYTITASAQNGGLINPTGPVPVVCGGDYTFESLGQCLALQDVRVDGVSVGLAARYTFTNVRADHTIEAVFVAEPPTFSLTASPSPLRCDAPDTLTVQVTGTIGGDLVFLDGIQLLGTVPLTGSTVKLLVSPPLPPGTHPISLTYNGGPCNVTITTPPTNFVVPATSGDSALATLTVYPNPSEGGTPVSYNLNLSIRGSAVPWLNGSAEFFENGNLIGTRFLGGGSASLLATATTTGTRVISARFLGAGCVPASWSNSVNLQVTLAHTAIQLVASVNPSELGQQFVTTAKVLASGGLASLATGTITIRDGGTVLGVAVVTSGAASFQSSSLGLGNHTLSFEYSGDGLFAPAQSSYTQVITRVTSAVALSSSSNPVSGLHVTLTARVSPAAATGTVTFSDPDGVFAVIPLVNGIARAAYTSSVFTTRALTAQYSGDATYNPSTALISQQFTGSPTALFISSSPNPSLVNRPVTLAVSLSPPGVTGTVTFRDNQAFIQMVPLIGNLAGITYTPATAGVHALTASYSGDTAYSASSSSLNQNVVVKFPTFVTLSSSQNPALAGSSITLSAQVSPTAASGSLEFRSDGVLLATVPVLAGAATLPYVVQSSGDHVLTATYQGDSIYAAAGAQVIEHSLSRFGSTTTLASSENPGLPGHVVTFTAHVLPSTATGSVAFYDGGSLFATAPLANSVATATLTLGTLGNRVITATYGGDSTYATSTAQLTQVTGSRVPSTLTITSSANPDTGRTVTLTFRVTPAAASGSVTVKANSVAIATLNLVGGVATLPYHVTAFGTYTIDATYPGDAFYFSSSASGFAQRFVARPTLTRLTSSSDPASANQPLTLSATVTPAPAGGLISFFDGTALLGTAPLMSGVATFPTSFSVLGDHALTATFPGDTASTASGGTLFLTVLGFPSTTLLTSTAALTFVGTWVGFTANVAPAPPTGTVAFSIDGAWQPDASLMGGVATFSTNTLPVGSHTIYVRYGGGAGIEPSNSNRLNLDIINYASATLHVLSPNGSENLLVGSAMNIRWETLGGQPSSRVSIYISRTLPPVWEPIADNVPNSGQYTWTATGPGTNQGHTLSNTALIGVFDLLGQSGSDASDLAFSLLDLATGTTLTQLDAEAMDDGVRLSWASVNRAEFTQLVLQRATAQSGPWQELAIAMHDAGTRTSAFDGTAEPGHTYWYRLLGTTAAGSQSIAGPVSAQSGAPLAFALAAPHPNPARGAMTVAFSVARSANVRLSVLDLQGREVATLADGVHAAGRYEAHWQGSLRDGQRAATGLYFLRYTTPDRVVNQRVTLVR